MQLMALTASSDEEEFVVHKKKLNHSSTHLLSDSDDDSPTQPAPAESSEESLPSNSENASKVKSSEINNGANALHVNVIADTKGNHFSKRRIIRALSNSDDENSTTILFGKSASNNSLSVRLNKVVGSDSESDGEIKVKSSRFKKRDKMVENMKRRFVKKERKKSFSVNNDDTIKQHVSLCDNETSTESDENQPSLSIHSTLNGKDSLETESLKIKSGSKQKQVKNKKTILIEEGPTPKRMSAKEAMENMTKIKSESNRMLRESRVLLPYHRPKQVSLKDILSRKKPGPDLPLRMNQEQLEQFAIQLEESQQKMKELYKNDDEDNGNVLNTKEHITEVKDLNNLEEKSINENPDNEIIQNCLENANKENEHLTINNEASKKNKPDKKSSDNYNGISLDTNNINDLNNDSSLNIPPVKGDDDVEESVKSTVSVFSKQHTNVDSKSINLRYDSESSLNIPTTKKNDDVQESIKLTDSVSSEHYSNVDSQLINLHYNSERLEFSIEQANSKGTGQDNNDNEAIIDYNINVKQIVDETSNQNTELSNTTECIAEIENAAISAKSIIESSSELCEKEKNKINVGTETRLSTDYDACAGEKETRKEGVPGLREHYSFDDDFPDDDVDISHIEAIMDKIEGDKDQYKLEGSPMLIKDVKNIKPRLSGAPGMVIDLDSPSASNKISGVEMLKHRYMFFSNIKTPEEKEREKEKQMKPGTKHRLLKLELEKQIAEQSIAEWTKRVEEEKQQQQEIMAINGELSECEDELDKIETECDKKEKDPINNLLVEFEQEEVEDEEDEVENEEEECKDLKERAKKTKTNTFIEDEAEVEDDEDAGEDDNNISGHEDTDNDVESDSSEEESSTEEEDSDAARKPKKGRIIKAFEDSDDEEQHKANEVESQMNEAAEKDHEVKINALQKCRSDLFDSQTTDPDEEISLAQPNQTNPEDMNLSFTEESESKKVDAPETNIGNSAKLILFGTQPNTQADMEAIVGMCSGNFPSDSPMDLHQVPPSISALVEGGGVPSSQLISEDILQLCSGKFEEHLVATQTIDNDKFADTLDKVTKATPELPATNKNNATKRLFDELEDADLPKTNEYFGSNINGNSANLNRNGQEENSKVLQKGKLIIESSDEETEGKVGTKKKKIKRKKSDKRALVISDDEEEEWESELSEQEDEELADEGERLVEYDSEENEVEVVPAREVRRRAHDFMEREAELSSEGEWAGSGDEDERGLDRLEREAGDDDVFHQGRLQRELGQMHAHDLMEQDRREVRMLQEILLEDGDLEGGGRQRRFRWKDTGEEVEERGTVPDEFGDTPEEERESEEQWRRQRHERQLFLRQLASEDKSEDILGLGTATSSLIASSVRVQSASVAPRDGEEASGAAEKNQAVKDFPSPVKNTFTIMQRQYRALVSGGGGAAALRRLAAALAPAEPPAGAAAARAPPAQRSFVFAPLAHTAPADADADGDASDARDDAPVRKIKRKADVPVGTPKLIKKLRLQEPRKSILQQLDT